MIKQCCDFCECEIKPDDESFEYKLKIKRKWYSFHESGWEKLILCRECQEAIVCFAGLKKDDKNDRKL